MKTQSKEAIEGLFCTHRLVAALAYAADVGGVG